MQLQVHRIALAANSELSFEGVRIEGTGFVLDEAAATQLLTEDPRNREVLSRYLRGDNFLSRLT